MKRTKFKQRLWLLMVVWVALPSVLVLLKHRRGESALEAWKSTMEGRGERFDLASFRPAERSEPRETRQILARFVQAAQALRGVPDLGYEVELRWTSPGRAAVEWRRPGLLNHQGHAIDWPDYGAAIAAAEPFLTEIRTAVANPPADLGWDYQDPLAAPVDPRVEKRYAAQWLARAAQHALHRDDLPAALDNLRALHGLVQLHRRERRFLTQMIRLANAKIALEILWSALISPAWTEEGLREIQHAWEDTEFLPDCLAALETERATVLHNLNRAKTGGTNTLGSVFGAPSANGSPRQMNAFDVYLASPVWRLAWADEDQLRYLQTMQALIDACRLGQTNRSLPAMTACLRASGADDQRESVFDSLRPWPGHIVPNGSATASSIARIETLRELAIAAVALRRYQLRQGTLPVALSDLRPEFLGREGWDWLAGAPLNYRRTENGLALLYSVGVDGRDGGGDGQPRDGRELRTMWDGNDAIWPQPQD